MNVLNHPVVFPEPVLNPYSAVDVRKLTDAQLSDVIYANASVAQPHFRRLQTDAGDEMNRRRNAARRKTATAQRQRIQSSVSKIQTAIDSVRPESIGTVSGICIPSEVWGSPKLLVRELVGPKAFDNLLAGSDDVALLLDHDDASVLARRSNFGLRLSKAPEGLRCEADLPDDAKGNAVAALLETGKVVGWSFRILFDQTDFTETDAGVVCRYIKRIAISEVSLLTESSTPAYPLVAPISFTRR